MARKPEPEKQKRYRHKHGIYHKHKKHPVPENGAFLFAFLLFLYSVILRRCRPASCSRLGGSGFLAHSAVEGSLGFKVVLQVGGRGIPLHRAGGGICVGARGRLTSCTAPCAGVRGLSFRSARRHGRPSAVSGIIVVSFGSIHGIRNPFAYGNVTLIYIYIISQSFREINIPEALLPFFSHRCAVYSGFVYKNFCYFYCTAGFFAV